MKNTVRLFGTVVYVLVLTILLTVVLTSCDSDETEQLPELTVETITPATARAGETITLTGTGFMSRPSRNEVLFKTTGTDGSGQVLAATATSLQVKVPSGAGDGPLVVTVAGRKVTTSQHFTIDTSLGAPTVASIAPSTGFVNTEVTITGTNFGDDKSLVKVLFADTEVTDIVAMTATTLRVKVPVDLPAGDVAVKVAREGRISPTSVTFTVRALPAIVTTAYYTNGADVYKGVIDKTGIHIDKLFAMGSAAPQCIVADFDGGYLYWGAPGNVSRAPVGGGAVEEIYFDRQRLSSVGDIAIDHAANAIYFSAIDAPGEHAYIMKGSLDGSAPLTVVLDGTADRIALNVKISTSTNTLYWAEIVTQSIYSLSLSGAATPVLLFDASDQLIGPIGIAIDDKRGRIYVTDNGDMMGTGASSILAGSLDGTGPLTTLVPPGDYVRFPYDTEVDAVNGYVYWMNYLDTSGRPNSDITRVKPDGTGIEVMFDGFENGIGLTLDTR